MPIFEYQCRGCRHRFELIVSASTELRCPACESLDLERQLSIFAVGGQGSALVERAPAGGCGTCGDPRGPGACSLD